MPAERDRAPIGPSVTRPRPGHADLAGVVKYGHDDIRNVLERASARETAARVAVGAIARQLLAPVGAEIVSHVDRDRLGRARRSARASPSSEVRAIRADAPLHCVDAERRAADDRGDRSRARGRRHDGRQLRGDRARRAARPRQLRAVGSQARWPAGAGADVDSGDQGRRHRPRPARSPPCPGSRVHDEILPRDRRRRRAASASPGRPTTPAASKAASPTARICASPAT